MWSRLKGCAKNWATWLEELASESNTIQAQEEKILGQEDCRPRPGKTMCRIWSVFHQYLWVFVFVWARAVCGTRYWVGAGCGCRAVLQKINMRKIEVGQGPAHDAHLTDFRIWGR